MRETLTVKVGDIVVIPLHENPSTGYRWEFRLSPGLERVDDTLEGQDNTRVGTWSKRVLKVRVTNPGRSTVKGVYSRPWEEQDSVSSERFGYSNMEYYLTILAR